MNNLWLGALGALAPFIILSLVLWGLAGPVWGWLALLLGILVLGARYLRNLQKLGDWVRDPMGTAVPQGSGAWGYVFSSLHRRMRLVHDQRQQLSAALNRFLDAAQALPDGVVILTHDNAIEWLNAAAGEHFGIDAAKDVGYPLTNLVRQPDFVRFLHAASFAEPLIVRPMRNPGQTLAVQVIAFGNERKLVISRNITHLERLETMRRDFVANVSHELKTPLTVVSGFIETLADNYPDLTATEVAQYLALAREQAARMQRLIDDLLTLSALETEAAPPLEEPVDVQALLQEVKRDAEVLSAGRHVIELDDVHPATLLGSAKELRSAFDNLAGNAVRYTPQGGRIRVAWRVLAEGAGVLTVEDDGIGIEAHHLPRLTERFYRVDRGRSRAGGGTGLGLAIVKHVLTRHQATLEITSELGKGSTFNVRFPARRVQSAAANPVMN